MSDRPTIHSLDKKVTTVLQKMDDNERAHVEILMRVKDQEDRFHKLFENGALSSIRQDITKIEGKIVLIEDELHTKINVLKDDVDHFRTSTKWIVGLLFGVISPATAWGLIKLIETLFHMNGN